MIEIFGLPLPVIAGQVMLGLVNGCFYAVLSLGLAVIFGLLRIVNFAHGAFCTLGAFGAWMLRLYLGLGYWLPLLVVPPAFTAAHTWVRAASFASGATASSRSRISASAAMDLAFSSARALEPGM